MSLSISLGAPSRAMSILRKRLHRLSLFNERCKRAFSYATGTLTTSQALDIVSECQSAAGTYPLLELSPADVLEAALESLAPHPRLLEYIDEGCQHVARKWSPHGDELSNAQDWAIEKAQEYAALDGITFLPADNADETSCAQEATP